MSTAKSAVRLVSAALEEGGNPSAFFEAEQMVGALLGKKNSPFALHGDTVLLTEQEKILKLWTEQRLAGYPLQYLLGEWSFYGRDFFVGPGVLIPRSDTENLIDAVLGRVLPEAKLSILDLCSGSGCIGLTLAAELPNSQVVLAEISEEALVFLRKNQSNPDYPWQNSEIRQLDLFSKKALAAFPEKSVDVLVANPPYLTEDDMGSLQAEVAFEPELALYGEKDGLAFYRQITKAWSKIIKPGGRIFLEIGLGQGAAVETMLDQTGFVDIKVWDDLGKIERVIGGIKK